MHKSCPASSRQMGEVNVSQVDTSDVAFQEKGGQGLQKIKETKQQYKNPKVNLTTKRSRTYNCKCIAPKYGSGERRG